MRYRIFEKNGRFGVQRKSNMFSRWTWWCGDVFKWSNFWGKTVCHRMRFYSLEEALDFIARENFGDDKGTLITSENIYRYINDDEDVSLMTEYHGEVR